MAESGRDALIRQADEQYSDQNAGMPMSTGSSLVHTGPFDRGVPRGRGRRRPLHPFRLMRPSARAALLRALVPALALLAPACAGSRPAEGPPRSATRRNFDVITQEEIEQRAWSSAFDLVSTLRPQWVRQRGPDSFRGTSTPVQTYLDNTRLTGIAALASISTAGLRAVEWVDGVEASARWGLDHSQGAIVLRTRAQ